MKDNLAEEATLDRARQEKAKEYAKIRLRLSLGEIALAAVLLLLLTLAGLSQILATMLTLPAVPAATVYMLLLMAAWGVLTAPLNYYEGYVLPRRYGLSIQKLGGWLADRLKASVLGLALAAAMTALVYWFISDYPHLWWLLTWGVVIIGGVVIAHLAPVIIVPIFIKMKPLADPDLKLRLGQLAQKAGIRVRGVYTLELSRKGTTANAALMGLGNTRRIVLTDTLLQQYPAAEIEVIVAHELGHHRHGDIPRSLVMQAAVWLVGLYLTGLALNAAAVPLGFKGISDVAALPLLLLIVAAFSLLLAPFSNARQRHLEAAADGYALRLTDNPEAFIAMMTRLTDQNLAEAQPARWIEILTYDHPSYYRRVELARRYIKLRSAGG